MERCPHCGEGCRNKAKLDHHLKWKCPKLIAKRKGKK